jgi:putative transposase
MLGGLLAAEGCKMGRRHVKTLMRRMGIEALYRRPRTTKPEPGHKILSMPFQISSHVPK